MNRSILGIFFLAGTVLLGCKKVEGEGGSSTIHGVVVEKKMNSVGGVIASYPIGDQDVFIIYGADDTFYDDKIQTSFDGSFEFKYLQPGTYKLFSYSECPSCPSGTKEVIQTIEIQKKKSTVEADTIYILNY